MEIIRLLVGKGDIQLEWWLFFKDFDNLVKVIEIIFSLVSIIGIIYGLRMAHGYVTKIRDKEIDSIFSFYSRLDCFLSELQYKLDKNFDWNILLYNYQFDSIKAAVGDTMPNEDELCSFKKFIKSFLDFIKNSDNQLILDFNFINDFSELEKKLFPLSEMGRNTLYGAYQGEEPLKKHRDDILGLIENLKKIIEQKRKDIVNKAKCIE